MISPASACSVGHPTVVTQGGLPEQVGTIPYGVVLGPPRGAGQHARQSGPARRGWPA